MMQTTVPVGNLDAARPRDVLKAAITFVMVEVGEGPFEIHGRPVSAADPGERVIHSQVDFARPLDVVANKPIESTIVIIVDEGRAGAPAGGKAGYSRAACGFGELSITVIMEKMISPNGGDKNIVEAIIVVVADGHAHPVETCIEA